MNKAPDEIRPRESHRTGPRAAARAEEVALAAAQARRKLKTEQRFRLRDLLRYNLKTVRAYLLQEAFQQLWVTTRRHGPQVPYDWCLQVMRSSIEPMKEIARSLRQHRELILNYFRAQKLRSSRVVEGLNKAKVTIRKSHGFRTFRYLD